jgi:hypothetical protein
MTQYWFRPKRYGYGATPITWEGWAIVLGFAALMAASVIVMNRFAGVANPAGWLIWAAVVGAGVLWLVQFSRQRTDGEWRWRWGRED